MAASSFILKIDRAREHLDGLQAEVAAWVETEPYEVVNEPDPERVPDEIPDGFQAGRFRVARVSEVPGRFAILIGDCVFNLRSSLDHIVMALAERATPGMTESQITGSQFPIFYTASKFKSNAPRYIGCIDPAAKAVIDALQPYHRGNGYASHPLWQLSELNNIDKHRKLAAVDSESLATDGAGTKGRAISYKTGNWDMSAGMLFHSAPGKYKLDAIFARWVGKPADPNQDVRLKPIPLIDIAFDDGGPAALEPVIPVLKSLCDFVGNSVITPLSKFL